MKKIALKASIICLTLLFFSSCKSTRKGCGLTSDAKKIEVPTAIEYAPIAISE